MISPENEKVSLGRVRRLTLYTMESLNIVQNEIIYATLFLVVTAVSMFGAESVFFKYG